MNLEDLFTAASLTESVNKLPALPTKVGASGLFTEKGIATTTVVIDAKDGRLVLVPNTSRNSDPQPVKAGGRTRRTFTCSHLPVTGQVLPVDVQNLTSFGSAEALTSQAEVINDVLGGLKNSVEATREFQRVGAVRGKILDADGSVIYDLFEEFGVSKKSINIAFGTAATNVRKACLDAKRHAESKLGGTLVAGFRAYCGPDWFDLFTNHDNVKAAFANYQEAADRLGGDNRKGFSFAGIEFVEYDATVSGQRYIPTDVAQVFPVAQGVFSLLNAPANYNEAVNTLGKPWYAKSEPRRMGKGWDVEVQANPLAMCMVPEALVELKAA
ncbi:MAG: major capsid protein [Xanthomonadaceae bacterium]|nr:major capsid protein [Xanthomonadaceae bacterium]